MDLPEDPFKTAERFIQIRDKCLPPTWTAQLQRINDMIVMPLITLCLFLLGSGDLIMLCSTAMAAYKVWLEWIEYTELLFVVQRMRLRAVQLGGPFIVTNDPKYMAYVWADAMVRSHTR